MAGRLAGKRILITCADRFMGPALATAFAAEGAGVLADTRELTAPAAVDALIADSGEIDVLVVNLAVPRPDKLATDTSDLELSELFEGMVYPLIRLGRAALPQMLVRRRGKILLMGSAAPLRGFARSSAYASARGAQLAWVRAAGAEVAADNVQINAIAQNFVDNPVYFPLEYQASEAFRERLKQVPAGRLGSPEEDAALAVFLASDECNFLCGQAVPFAGGWAA